MPNHSSPAGGATAHTHLSRHYRKAQQDRGSETKQRLVLAALDAFGRYGFEGASTREIARRADANLAAIVYHFGSKEALHLAVAEYVVEALRSRIAPSIQSAEGPVASKREARIRLQRILDAQIQTMLGEEEAELWGRFIMREQMEPTSAFEIIYAFMSTSHAVSRQLLATLLDLDPASDETSMRVFALFGQVVMFRVAQPLVMRTMGRTVLDEAGRKQIVEIVTHNVDRIVGISLKEAEGP